MPSIDQITPVPTGGVVTLQFTTSASGNISLSRAISGASGIGPQTVLYSGPPLTNFGADQIFIDLGDNPPGQPLPLNPNSLYIYTLTDQSGSVQSQAIQPTSAMIMYPDALTGMIMRVLQSTITSNISQAPSGTGRATITHAMPLAQLPPLPFIVVFLELLQQGEQFIGDDVANPSSDPKEWTMYEFAKRIYRISILSLNPVELDFYRNLVLSAFKVMHAYIFPLIGENMMHRYQAASYQDTGDLTGKSPGFYGCDISLELEGTFNLEIDLNFPIIQNILITASGTIGSLVTTITAGAGIIPPTSGTAAPFVVTSGQAPNLATQGASGY